MALFGLKKKDEKKLDAEAKPVKAQKTATKAAKPVKTVKEAAKPIVVASGPQSSAATSIIRPRITEKSGILSQNGVYTFEVARNANKQMIAAAIKALYKVTPVKIGVINQAAKNIFVKGRMGTVASFRKAIVTVKKGDKIDFV